MTRRENRIITGHIYHVFNRSVASEKIFISKIHQERFLFAAKYYCRDTIVPASHAWKAPASIRNELLRKSLEDEELVQVLCFAIMPTHFHFLVIQKSDEGIRRFISKIQNSFAMYYNKRNARHGALFCHRYGSARIRTAKQLKDASRYIHLNPVEAELVPLSRIESYPLTSLMNYWQNKDDGFVMRRTILEVFGSYKNYREYIFSKPSRIQAKR